MRARLEESLGPVRLSDLGAHLARDAVIVVAPSLDLLDVGVAVAENDTGRIDAWIRDGVVTKPTLEQLERWGRTEGEVAHALVVQPFVLVREL